MRSMILAHKWDTNGGNERFVQAAKKALILHSGQDYGGQGNRWRLTAMHLAAGQETAGIGTRYAEASTRTENLIIRAAHRTQTYLDYPYDILWTPRNDALVRQLANDADVIHLNDRTYAYFQLGLDKLDKPALLHHHGMAYRTGSHALNQEARKRRMVQAVSTVDLLRFAEDDSVEWLPAPYNIDEMVAIREANRRPEDGRVRVVQTPTNRAIKSTDKLEEAVAKLQSEGHPIDLIIGEQMAWRDALPLKATADVFFDQTQLGYGCSAIEAWGMGLPVIAGGDEWTEARMRVEFGTPDLPFFKADDDVVSIYDALKAMLDPAIRKVWAARGMAHVRKFHDELPALEKLVGLYIRAIENPPIGKPKPDVSMYATGPGRFRCTKYPALSFLSGDLKFQFIGGRINADEHDAPWVRLFAARETSRMYGITEEAPVGVAESSQGVTP